LRRRRRHLRHLLHPLTLWRQCVDQGELEIHDGVGAGKYTIGLGQTKMSFCDDREGMALEAKSG